MQLCYIYQCTSIKIKPELKKNILNFAYGINYKYEGMLAHSFDRLYVVTELILPSISKLNYDDTCAYLDNKTSMTQKKEYLIFSMNKNT